MFVDWLKFLLIAVGPVDNKSAKMVQDNFSGPGV